MTPEALFGQPFGLRQHLRALTSPVYVVSDDPEGVVALVGRHYKGPQLVIEDGRLLDKKFQKLRKRAVPTVEEIVRPSSGEDIITLYYILDDEWLQDDVLRTLIQARHQREITHLVIFMGGPKPGYEGVRLLPRIGEPLSTKPAQPNIEGWPLLDEESLLDWMIGLHLNTENLQPFRDALRDMPDFQAQTVLSHAYILAKDLLRASSQGEARFKFPTTAHVAEQLPRVVRDMARLNGWP